jgi:molecular chaperone GrpE
LIEGLSKSDFENEINMTSKDNIQTEATAKKGKGSQQKSPKTGKTATSKKQAEKSAKKAVDTARIKELQKDLQEQKDRYLRLSAEFDNFRKRTLREKMEMSKLAGEEIYVKILPVLDDLDRAMKAIRESTDVEAVKEGMQLIYNKFQEYLNQQGVKEIEAIHQEFNTDVHEAVTKIPAEDKKLKGKVVDVIEKGYYLNEKIIRFSKVVIGE